MENRLKTYSCCFDIDGYRDHESHVVAKSASAARYRFFVDSETLAKKHIGNAVHVDMAEALVGENLKREGQRIAV